MLSLHALLQFENAIFTFSDPRLFGKGDDDVWPSSGEDDRNHRIHDILFVYFTYIITLYYIYIYNTLRFFFFWWNTHIFRYGYERWNRTRGKGFYRDLHRRRAEKMCKSRFQTGADLRLQRLQHIIIYASFIIHKTLVPFEFSRRPYVVICIWILILFRDFDTRSLWQCLIIIIRSIVHIFLCYILLTEVFCKKKKM